MFQPRSGTKEDPCRRWKLSDRVFFAHGACHILAQVFLERFPDRNFHAVWIRPGAGYRGNHVYVTNGSVAFDYRGYVPVDRLVNYYREQYRKKYPGWHAELVGVTGNLCDPEQMIRIGMQIRGPDQFLENALPRAMTYLKKYDQQHDSLLLI